MIYGCEGHMYCGRQIEVHDGSDQSAWSTVIARSTTFEVRAFKLCGS